MADPYTTLGVARNATEKDIKSAYRTLAKELHPDRNKDNPKATERFGKVTQAYDLLSDKDKRAQFDRGEIDAEGNQAAPFGFGAGGQSGGFAGSGFGGAQRGYRHDGFEGFGAGAPGAGAEGVDLGDIFEGLFGGRGGMGSGAGRGAPPAKGANVQYRLQVPFVDAATCVPQRITLGDGKTIDLKLPAGVDSGTQMRLSGKGQPGPGANPGHAGDAIVTIDVGTHPFYTRAEDNILLDLPVSLDEALNGAKVKVPTVDGPVMLTVAPGSSSGRTLRLKGKGFTRKDGTRGDQLVTLQIELPAEDSELAKRLDGWRDGRDLRGRIGV